MKTLNSSDIAATREHWFYLGLYYKQISESILDENVNISSQMEIQFFSSIGNCREEIFRLKFWILNGVGKV
jgi:hypothetical protein